MDTPYQVSFPFPLEWWKIRSKRNLKKCGSNISLKFFTCIFRKHSNIAENALGTEIVPNHFKLPSVSLC